MEQSIELGAGYVASVPQVFGSRLLVCVADTLAGAGWLAVVDLAASPLPSNPDVVAIPLQLVPGSWPPVAGLVPGSDPLAPQVFVMVVSKAGEGQTVVLDTDLSPIAAGYRWPTGLVVSGPVSPGGALVADGLLGRVGQSGDWLAGWPRRESPVIAAGPAAALVARIVDAPDGYEHYLFTAADGRLVARGARGEDVPGWPLGGPGASAGTPALGVFGGGAEVDLVAVGSFPRIVGNADDGERLVTQTVSELVVWHDVASAATLWPMWGGSAWRSGGWDAENFAGVPPVAAGTGLVPGSHFCYPNPLSEGVLHVRGQMRRTGRALVTIHDLTGEQVATTSWRAVAGVEPFSLDVDLSAVASGMYLCRLVVESDGGGSDVSVVAFAVAH
jgi:hypothetical protein